MPQLEGAGLQVEPWNWNPCPRSTSRLSELPVFVAWHHTHSKQPTSVQVVLLDRSIWNSRGLGMPAVSVMSAHGEYDTPSGTSNTGLRVYGASGCADTACRNAGWTVEYSLVVLTSSPATTMSQLHTDAAAIRTHLKEAYSQHLQTGEYAVNVQITIVGTNEGYQVDTQVCPSTAMSRFAFVCCHDCHTRLRAHL
jgi:hypothetical protein